LGGKSESRFGGGKKKNDRGQVQGGPSKVGKIASKGGTQRLKKARVDKKVQTRISEGNGIKKCKKKVPTLWVKQSQNQS